MSNDRMPIGDGETKADGCKPSVLSDLLECTDDYEGEDRYCYRCNNMGTIVVCVDDICHGLGYCIHGDGEITCPDCNGESAF